MSFEHCPASFWGLREISCIRAELVVTLEKFEIHDAQHSSRPQYFRNAEEVITDTFHGSIFSVITHRPFTTLIRKSVGNSYGNEEKLSDLLKRLGLANRMTTKIEDTENINEKAIDYAKVDEQLKAHREVAKEYLRKNLEE